MDPSVGLLAEGGIWGDIPNWVSSVAAILALIFAALAAVAARKTHNIESERDRRAAEARQRRDAALVSAWWGESANAAGQWGTFVRNASGAPIYQVYCTVVGLDDHSDDRKVHYPLVPPSEVAHFCPIDSEAEGRSPIAERPRRVKVSFTDAAGVRWTRNQYGRLAELQSSLRVKLDSDRATSFKQFEDDFLATYGVRVSFEMDPDRYPQEQFMVDVRKSGVADALVCPHDWIGAMIDAGVIEPTLLSPDQRKLFPAWTLQALTYEGRLYGVPMTTDTVALIRNTELVPEPPATFDDLVAIAQSLCRNGKTEKILAARVGYGGDPFQTWPLFTSAGGSLFGCRPNGQWDPTQLMVDSPGSVEAFEQFREMGEAGMGLLRRSVDGDTAHQCFASGRTPFLIGTSDGLRLALRAGIKIGVSPVPPFGHGKKARAFTLVHGLTIAKHGACKAVAHDLFADYLTHRHVMTRLSNDVVAPIALLGDTPIHSALQIYRRMCQEGDLMPSFPAMQAIWRILGKAQAAAVAGEPAKPVAYRAACEIAAALSGNEVHGRASSG
ncbi:sugar ABC transporter substrate-binding protein [Micromonospora sp. NBC_01739]|uniref:sugar ABC transporter substrate-binding protein n=1 Tax=Micromonospora sp. NBC_01739 TaxID=2975985 RepID=UPI002E12C40E|nr:extracellular solute-binding protein [Micromonospora sp. NBC_01739]